MSGLDIILALCALVLIITFVELMTGLLRFYMWAYDKIEESEAEKPLPGLTAAQSRFVRNGWPI